MQSQRDGDGGGDRELLLQSLEEVLKVQRRVTALATPTVLELRAAITALAEIVQTILIALTGESSIALEQAEASGLLGTTPFQNQQPPAAPQKPVDSSAWPY